MKQSDYNKRNKKFPTNVIEGWLIVAYKRFTMRVKIDLPDGEYLMVQGKLIRIKDVSNPYNPFDSLGLPEFLGIMPKSDVLSLKDMQRFAKDDSGGLRPHLEFVHFRNKEIFSTNADTASFRPACFSAEAQIMYSPIFPKEECGVYKTKKGYFVSWGTKEIVYTVADRVLPEYDYLKIIRSKHAFVLEKAMIFEAMKVCNYIGEHAIEIKKSILYPKNKNGYDYKLQLEKEVPANECDGVIMPINNDEYYSFNINMLYSLFGNHKKIILNLGEKHEPANFKYLD